MTNKKSKLLKLMQLLGKDKVFKNKNLFPYLTLRTNTLAEYYFEAKTKEEFQRAVKVAFELKLPVFILGGGSNIAVIRPKIKGLVIRNLYLKKTKEKETQVEVDYCVSSGYPTSLLVAQMIDEGLEGLEYQKGLPGTIGGAVYMNSKWTKPLKYVSDIVVGALLLDQKGDFKQVDKKYFQFEHGYSILNKTKEILVEITLRFKKKKQEILLKRAEEATFYRNKTQPKGVSSCGCFFRNISDKDKERLKLPTNSVGYLIDNLNLKGLTVGDFTISDIHGNFIINRGGKDGKSTDLKKLLTIVKNKVKKKYEIELKEEVIIV